MAAAYLEKKRMNRLTYIGSYQKFNVIEVTADKAEQERLQPNNKQSSMSHKNVQKSPE